MVWHQSECDWHCGEQSTVYSHVPSQMLHHINSHVMELLRGPSQSQPHQIWYRMRGWPCDTTEHWTQRSQLASVRWDHWLESYWSSYAPQAPHLTYRLGIYFYSIALQSSTTTTTSATTYIVSRQSACYVTLCSTSNYRIQLAKTSRTRSTASPDLAKNISSRSAACVAEVRTNSNSGLPARHAGHCTPH